MGEVDDVLHGGGAWTGGVRHEVKNGPDPEGHSCEFVWNHLFFPNIHLKRKAVQPET